MLFKSDTMNALVACDLLDEGYSINESLEGLDAFSFLLEEGRSGELYSLVLWEGNRLDEAGRSPAANRKRAGRAIRRADKANQQRNQAQQDAADERTHGEAETARADAGELAAADERQHGVELGRAARKKSQKKVSKLKKKVGRLKGEADELRKTARGSDARKRTADKLRKLRGTVADLKSKQGKGQDGPSQEGGRDDGERDSRSLRDKFKEAGDKLEYENNPQRSGASGPSSARGGGGRGPDTGSADRPSGGGSGGSGPASARQESEADAEHRRDMEKRQQKHDLKRDKKKQKARRKWGKTFRKGLEGAGKLVKRGLEGAGKLAGDAARGFGRGIERMDQARTDRYKAQTDDRTAEGEHKRGMERDAQSQKHERGMKTDKEGETSAERMHRDSETTKRTTPSRVKAQAEADSAKSGGDSGGGSDKMAQHRSAMADRAKTRTRRRGSSSKRIRQMADSYSPRENSPELGMMSEHLKVDQSGEMDHWQMLMEDVINEKKSK